MNLDEIRKNVEEYENTIIFLLLERSKYNFNKHIYKNINGIFYNLLADMEILYEKSGKFNNPIEHPFTNPKTTCLSPIKHEYNKILDSYHKEINHNSIILAYYISTFLPYICLEGPLKKNDNNISIMMRDIDLLQTISNRCHLGKVIGSIKVKENFIEFKKCKDDQAIYTLLTNKKVEETIINRIDKKIKIISDLVKNKNQIDLDNIKNIFNIIIVLTKEIQVKYIKTLL